MQAVQHDHELLAQEDVPSPRSLHVPRVATLAVLASALAGAIFGIGFAAGAHQSKTLVNNLENAAMAHTHGLDGIQQKQSVNTPSQAPHGTFVSPGGTVWMGFTCHQVVTTSATGQQVFDTECDPKCFPGEARVTTLGGEGIFRHVPVKELEVGSLILVKQLGSKDLSFEPVLGFLHSHEGRKDDRHRFLTVAHEQGEFRATAGHLVFVVTDAGQSDKPVGELREGDKIFAVVDHKLPTLGVAPSKVLAIREAASAEGMFAPLTASGTLVVDGVMASAYAKPAQLLPVPHGAVHAFLFPVRVWHALGLAELVSSPTASSVKHTVHPYIEASLRLGTGKLLALLSAH